MHNTGDRAEMPTVWTHAVDIRQLVNEVSRRVLAGHRFEFLPLRLCFVGERGDKVLENDSSAM